MPELTRRQLVELYRTMVLIRRFEERGYELYSRGLLPGTIHSAIGQEAVAAGVCAALQPDDLVLSTHRGHGHCIAKGLSVRSMMAEVLGRETGVCRGKGGSMHLCDVEHGFLGCNAIVGANLPLAVGVGLAIKYRRTGQICVCFLGDGAVNEGTFHESLNLASVWNLPVLFVCENNLYALTTHVNDATAAENIVDRAAAYAMPGVRADGMEVTTVFEVTASAVERVRSGDGPALLEFETYRFKGHSRGDPDYGPYRTKDEHDAWLERDPLNLFRQHGFISDEEAGALDEEAQVMVEDAVEFALESPHPDLEEALKDVYPASSTSAASASAYGR